MYFPSQQRLSIRSAIPWGIGLCLLFATSSAAADRPVRVSRSLEALYTFGRVENGVIADTSGVKEPMNLRIDKPQGVQFRAGRMIVGSAVSITSDGPATKVIAASRQSHELTIEAWVKPQTTQQSGPARIVSLSANPSLRNFTLGQDKGHWEIRLRTTATDNNGMPSTSSPENSVNVAISHLALVRNAEGVSTLYVDGQPSVTQVIAGSFENWSPDFRLSLANEVTGDRPWLGEIHLVALYSRALTDVEVEQNFRAGVSLAVDYAASLPPVHRGAVDFVRDIQPLFRKHCYECHSADHEDGGVNLGIRQRARQGGHAGPLFLPGDSLNSRMIHLVAAIDKEEVMPPDSNGLSREEVGLLRAWIDQGATWPMGVDIPDPREEKARTHWAFQPMHAVNPPVVAHAAWPQTPIDHFILSKLESAQLAPQARAEARQLIRRLTLDLIGLPPTPEEVEEFCRAAASDHDAAVTALIDRLLQSRHYGERWGRHWLDVARYADSDGQESDRDRPTAYHYRDFVIHALNDDMPYDQFIRWQLAGDEYAPVNPQAVAATGFIVAGPFAALPDRLMEDERLRNRYNELDDMLSTIGTGFLGLTLGCVRCHDHKYDAIPARDYYSMMSAFHGGERAEVPLGDTTEKVLAYRDLGPTPSPNWLFQRGNYYDRDQPVSLGFVSILTRGKSPDDYWTEARNQSPAKQSTGQRRALADWMTDVDHGAGVLLARVIVNRVWQHHFGQGIVRTVGDFGVRSDPPTHPELLEWLTRDFIEHGWRLKHLHQMIARSAVFQQASTGQPSAIDPDNRLLGKMPLQRLEGEILRDSMLAVSGTLNDQSYGPAVKPPIASEAILARNLKDGYPDKIADSPELRRRSIYLFHKRVVPYPLLQAFDKPDAQQSCSRRDNTTVAPQALALLNDPFMRTVSLEFAARLIQECGNQPQDQIRRAYQRALSRNPTDNEMASAEQFLTTQRTARRAQAPTTSNELLQHRTLGDYCQVLFSLNEFVYID